MIYPLVFLSGLASLVYEIAWIRQSSFAFGSSALALSTVLAVFFLGLGLGSWLFGCIGTAARRPLLWCAGLELLLALNGYASPELFDWAETLFGHVYLSFEPGSGALLAVRGGLVTLLLLPPTLLMGGTLPLFCRQAIHDPARISTHLGWLYGVNTLGATLGCGLAGFLLLPTLGLNATLHAAAGLNVVVGLGFAWLGMAAGPLPLPDDPSGAGLTRDETAADTPPRFLPGLLFFLIGAVALANELIWARFFTHFIRNSVYTYTVALGVVLAGTALGSLAAGHSFDRSRGPRSLLTTFAGLQAVAAALTLGLTHLPAEFWRSLIPWGVLPYVLLMLPPALVAGACFPLLNRVVAHDPRRAPRDIGYMTALNILGCIVGSLVTGYGLLPWLGLDAAIYAAAGGGILAAGLGMWGSSNIAPEALSVLKDMAANNFPNSSRLIVGRALARQVGLKSDLRIPGSYFSPIPKFATATVLAAALWLTLLTFSPVRVPHDFMNDGDVLLDLVEGYNSNLAVVQRKQVKTLLIDRLWQGVEHRNYQIMVAHVPMLHYPDAKEVLVVGLGAGTTAGRFLRYGIEQLHIVDIEPRLFDFTRKHFASAWMDDPRVRLIREDGRNYLKHTGRQYDVVSVEIGQLDRPGVGVFYTREFYREVHARLRQDGMIVQFVPLSFLRPAEFASVLKTFLAVFPNARLWYNTEELLLIGFKGETRRPSPLSFVQTVTELGLRDDLDMYYWGGSNYVLTRFPVFLAGFLAAGPELSALADVAPAEEWTDDRLQLSYSVSDYDWRGRRAMMLVPFLQQHLSPIDEGAVPGSTDAGSLDTARRLRDLNVADIAASDILDQLDTQPPLSPQTVYERANEALRWNPKSLAAQFRLRAAMMAMGQGGGTEETVP
ncbi:fused MFS/spermidine synthase [Methylomagnum sp.]